MVVAVVASVVVLSVMLVFAIAAVVLMFVHDFEAHQDGR
jgi:hypothetical protein